MKGSMTIEHDIVAILDDPDHPEEPQSQLWDDLATWVFEEDDDGELVREIPSSDEMTADVADRLLDEAAIRVQGLKNGSDWASAARYFEAENVHGLSGPAARRAIAIGHRGPTAASRGSRAIETRPALPLDAVLAAARRVLGARNIEAAVNDAGIVELFVVVRSVAAPRGPDEIDLEKARAQGFHADEGDELLVQFHYLPADRGQAIDMHELGMASLFGIPSHAFDAMQRELASWFSREN